MNDQATPALFRTDRGILTADVIQTELHYGSYRANRAIGMTPERHARFFPNVDTDAFEARYQAELAQARIADDHLCPGCGARGFRFPCGACEASDRA